MIPSRHPNLVLFQKKVKFVDPQWGDQFRWVEDRQVWVSINPDRGREIFKGAELEAVVTHTIRGDYLELDGVSEVMRAVYNDTHDYGSHGIRADSLVFDLLAVMPDYDGHGDIMIQANLKGQRYGALPEDIPQ